LLCLYPLLGDGVEKSLEVWSLMGFFEISLLLLLLGFILHAASPYYRRATSEFKLKISSENFGIIFLWIRDLALFASFGIGAMLINPDIFADIKLALPFVPLGVVLLGFALVVKVHRNLEGDRRDRKLFMWLLSLSALLQYFGFVFVMEAAPSEWVSSGKAGRFWAFLRGLRSNLNPDLSMWTFYLVFPLLAVVFLLLILGGVRRGTRP